MTAQSPPTTVAKVLALRSAGHTLASISAQTGLSVSTVQRYLKKSKAVKGKAMESLIADAQQQMKNELISDEGLRSILTELILDTSAQVRLARIKSAEILEQISATDNESAALACRALAAHSTAIKNHTDTLRNILPPQAEEPDTIPELVVRVLTEEDVIEIRKQQKEELDLIRGTT